MAEAAFAVAGSAARICGDVENDVVGTRGIAGNSANRGQRAGGRQVVQAQQIAHTPRDIVVGARSVAAQTYSAHEMVALCVETKPAAEDVYAADFMSGQGFGSGAVVRRRSCVSGGGVHRRSEEHTSELQSPCNLVCRLLLEK